MARNPNKVREGRERFLKSPQEMREKAEVYFARCDEEERSYTMPGLALALGFSERHAIAAYARLYPEFADTVAWLRSKIEEQRVQRLIDGKGSTPGQIFDLKNNFGYTDKVENTLQGPGGGPIRQTWQIEFVGVDDDA